MNEQNVPRSKPDETSASVPLSGSGTEKSTFDKVDLSAKLTIWSAYRDIYMKYVTMWFTASTLAFVIFSFCMKTVIVDETSYATKFTINVVMLVFAVLAICVVTAVHRRAGSFADHVIAVESLLRRESGLNAYFRPLPGSPMMKKLIMLSAVGVWIALVICVIVTIGIWRQHTQLIT